MTTANQPVAKRVESGRLTLEEFAFETDCMIVIVGTARRWSGNLCFTPLQNVETVERSPVTQVLATKSVSLEHRCVMSEC